MELPRHPRPPTAEAEAAPEAPPKPQPQKPPITPLNLNLADSKPVADPTKPNPFAMSAEQFRAYLQFFDDHGRVDHIAIWNDIPVRASRALHEIVDDNGWFPHLVVWANGGKREAWDGAKDWIVSFIRICDDMQKGMRAIYVFPDVKKWLNDGINGVCGTVWCALFPDTKGEAEARQKALAVLEPLFEEWCREFATPWWKSARKGYSSFEAMIKDKKQYELAAESVKWLEKNMADRLPRGVEVPKLAESFVVRFGDVASDLEKDLLNLLAKIERDKVDVADEHKKGLREISRTQVRDR